MTPGFEGELSAAEVAATAGWLAHLQLSDGMIPWFPGGHCDPWNLVETAMALTVAGRVAEAERAYGWLAEHQRRDGSWHAAYVAGAVQDAKLDTNVCAYIATGVWHHWCCTGDASFLERMWPVVTRAIDFVLTLQTPRGEIIWARHADGTPWSFALLTGSSSIHHSLRCALAVAAAAGRERPAWEQAADRLADVITTQPDAFVPKDRWAMDWYYPVLAGVLTGAAAEQRLDAGVPTFVMADLGVRCVSDRPWVTAAETAECALAHLAAGRDDLAGRLLACTRRHRDDDGSYFTGIVYPEGIHFPADERSAYTGAAVLLAADALSGTSPASSLFTVPPAAVPEPTD